MDTLELPVTETRHVTWYHPDDSRPRWAPRDRPPVVGRVFAGLLGFGAMLTTVALLLSDRAPGLVDAMFGDRARRLWARIDSGDRVDPAIGSAVGNGVTSTDFVVHLAIWAVVTVLVGLAVWTWRGLAFSAAVLGAVSLVVELAQGRYASTRSVQATDAVANLVGISLGATVAGVCFVVWSTGATVARRLGSSGRRSADVR